MCMTGGGGGGGMGYSIYSPYAYGSVHGARTNTSDLGPR